MAGIYIHIPFCHSKCSYCDFYSMPRLELRNEYVNALIKDIRLWLSKPETQELTWNTVYIGGGTPSLLSIDELSRIIAELPLTSVSEFTIEANPEDITPEWASSIIKLGINRVSIGIQSFSDDELKAIGRNHSSAQAMLALEVLRNAGVGNISADLIYGLPGQSVDSWQDSIARLTEFHPEHISAYSLSFEKGTKIYAQRSVGKVKEADEDTVCLMYDTLTQSLSKSGYEHYEISNFGLPGKHSRHNSSYWTFTPYLGIGVAAHGYINGRRYANPWNIKKYIEALSSGHRFAREEILHVNDIYNEYVMTALRTSAGIKFSKLASLTDATLCDKLKAIMVRPLNDGLLERTDDGIRIPEKKWMVSDSIIMDLMI